MTQKLAEPPDHHAYDSILFFREHLEFYLAAVRFYETLLAADLSAIETDPDLKLILGEKQREELPIIREIAKANRLRECIEETIEERAKDAFDYHVTFSHGTIRFIKSVSILYLRQLKQRRNVLASRANISRYALEAIDSQITRLEEMTSIGLFQNASPTPLLVDQVVPGPPADDSPVNQSISKVERPRPVVISSVEIFDPELRERCLDLFEKFKEDGQRDRLDTVITEATRVLENRLRKLSGAPATCTGTDLAAFVFGGQNPRLVASSVPAEQDAVHLLFRGVFGFIRNQVHHRLIGELQPGRVLQVLALIDYLISVAQGALVTADLST